MKDVKPILYAGNFERSIDAKKRMAVPASWLREKEGEELYVMLHSSKQFVVVMPSETLLSTAEEINSSDRSPKEKRMLMRNFYSRAYRVTTDGQGRILLPSEQCEQADLRANAMCMGVQDRFEIWNPERCDASMAAGETTYQEAADELGL